MNALAAVALTLGVAVNLISNPGFESVNVWSYVNAQRSSGYSAHAGSYVAELTFTGSQVGAVAQRVTPVSGQAYQCSVWVQRISGANGITAYMLDDQQNVAGIAQIAGADVTPGWHLLSFLATTTRPFLDFTVQTIDDGGFTPSVWIVDDALVEQVPGVIVRLGWYPAFSAVFDYVKAQLDGGGEFHTNLEQRLYGIFVHPATSTQSKFPVACLYVDHEREIDDWDEQQAALRRHLTLKLRIWFAKPATAKLGDNSHAALVLKAIDDLEKLFLPSPTNEAWDADSTRYIRDIRLISTSAPEHSQNEGSYPYAELTFELMQHAAADNLGP